MSYPMFVIDPLDFIDIGFTYTYDNWLDIALKYFWDQATFEFWAPYDILNL